MNFGAREHDQNCKCSMHVTLVSSMYNQKKWVLLAKPGHRTAHLNTLKSFVNQICFPLNSSFFFHPKVDEGLDRLFVLVGFEKNHSDSILRISGTGDKHPAKKILHVFGKARVLVRRKIWVEFREVERLHLEQDEMNIFNGWALTTAIVHELFNQMIEVKLPKHPKFVNRKRSEWHLNALDVFLTEIPTSTHTLSTRIVMKALRASQNPNFYWL